jgi:hypothetical protein
MRSQLAAIHLILPVALFDAACLPPPACHCPDLAMSTTLVAPADGATNVPVNAFVWLGSSETFGLSGTIEVSGPSGSIEGTTAQVTTVGDSGGAVTVFQPSQPLPPNTSFTASLGGKTFSTFTTGSTTAGSAPAVPTVSVSKQTFSPGECETESATVTLNQPGIFVVAQVQGEESAFNPPPATGRVVQVITSTSTSFVEGTCANWAGNSSLARLGAVDIAGQFSGWTDWQTIK